MSKNIPPTTQIVNNEEQPETLSRNQKEHSRPSKEESKSRVSSAGSTNAFDVESLTKLMANEYAMSIDPYNVQKGQELMELLWIKKQSLELKAAELKIRRLQYRQRDKALYLSITDEELKAILRQRIFG
nr:hypothetical protein [Tanacetum cinerariifolium]